MQFGGIGSSHDSHSHQVTGCIHETTHVQKTGGMKAAPAAVQTQQSLNQVSEQQQPPFSLSGWLRETFESGKKRWLRFWGNGAEAVNMSEEVKTAEAGDKSSAAQTMAQIGADNEAAGVAGQTANKASLEQQARINQYFRTVTEQEAPRASIMERLRTKVRETAGQLADHLAGRFFGAQTKSSFQTKQERPREDLRKRSRYRKEGEEIECILTDESYLLDSYDRKGEYSQLTTKK